MSTIYPAKLRKGDTIGVVSPSSPVTAFCPKRLQRGVEELQKHGFKVKIGKHVSERYKHTAGTIQQRIEDLHAMFADEEVKGIICTIGGLNSNQLLEFLDYELIKSHPKVFMGFSDITALLDAIYAKTGLVTYLGPAILPQFGEFGGMLSYSWEYFEKVIMQSDEVRIVASQEWTDEFTPWDKEDNRPRVMKPNEGIKVLKPGKTSGIMIGGNIGTLLLLNGTSYMPDMRDAILCVEEDEVETPATMDRFFMQLRHIGAYSKIKGMLIGRFNSKVGFKKEDSLEEIVLAATEGCDFPILYDLDFSHTDPMITIPIGGKCDMQTEDKSIVFSSFIQ